MKSFGTKLVVLFFILSLLVSCGGGGGNASPPPPPDTTPPTVLARSPLAGASQVNVGTSISATFSEPMNTSTITTSTFSVSPTAGGPAISGTFSFSGATATFKPSADLTVNTSYTVTITTGVKDAANNAMLAMVTWTFTTPDKIWGTAGLIETGSGAVDSPDVAIDGGGNALAVWAQFDGVDTSIYSNRYVPGTGWSAPVLIESATGIAASPQVAMDGSGNAIAVWSQGTGTSDIYANRYVSGTGWGTAQLIETGADTADGPHVAVNGSGTAIAVWRQWDALNNRSDIWANRYAVSTWGTATVIDAGTGNAGSARVAIDSNGNAVALWLQYDGAGNSVYANRYVYGTGWGAPVLIENTSSTAHDPQVAVDPSGNAVAVWSQSDGVDESIYACRYVIGTGWGAAQSIETGAGAAASPQIAMDSSGNAIALWFQYQSNSSPIIHIYASRYAAGTGWGTPVIIDSGSSWATSPQIAMNTSGNAVAVWKQLDGTNDSIYANRYVSGTGWGTAQLIETGSGDAEFPQVATNSNDNAVAVWEQKENPTLSFDMWANELQ
jgi:hypothetical protein